MKSSSCTSLAEPGDDAGERHRREHDDRCLAEPPRSIDRPSRSGERRSRIELVTRDPAILDRVRRSVERVDCVLEVASDPPAIRALLSTPVVWTPRLVDLAAAPHQSSSLVGCGEQLRGDELVLILPRARQRCCRVEVYPRDALGSLLEDLSRLVPPPPSSASRLILGSSPEVELVREQIRHVAPYHDVSVLILGETGTGKELVAQSIHAEMGGGGEFVAVNCAAIPEALFESELFGHEAGAYTGAQGPRVGLLQAAGSGTLFLDEVGDMPLALQAKLLRVLETRTFRRLGSNRDLRLEARVVSATNRGLTGWADGALRSDVLYRLAGFTIVLPPLRERVADIELLARAFLVAFAQRYGRDPLGLSAEAAVVLRSYPWPGNVRELKALMAQVAISTKGAVIEREDILRGLARMPVVRRSTAAPPAADPDGAPRVGDEGKTSSVHRVPLRTLEREMIVKAFRDADGNLTHAAAALGIPRTTLRDKLRRYGIDETKAGSA